MDEYAERFADLRRRHGITLPDARRILSSRNYYAMMMVESGDADGVIAGLRAYYPATIRPALQILKTRPGVKHVSGAYLLMFKNRMFVLADTTVNINPTAEQLAEIAALTAETAKRFNLEPRIAMISFSNFGSTKDPEAEKVAEAVRILKERRPDLVVEGEMQADTAVYPEIAESEYPWSAIQGDANVLVFAKPRRRERGVQTAVAPRRRRGHRPDPAGTVEAGARAAARRRRQRHREHGRDRGARRAGRRC